MNFINNPIKTIALTCAILGLASCGNDDVPDVSSEGVLFFTPNSNYEDGASK